MEVQPVGAELFHVDSWMDRYDEAVSCFSNILNVPKWWKDMFKMSNIWHCFVVKYFVLLDTLEPSRLEMKRQ
jgi:hypothetical protein